MTSLTLLCDGQSYLVDFDGTGVPAEEFRGSTGWSVEPQGLCRGDVCIPMPTAQVTADGRIDVAAAASVLRRPWVVEPDAHVGVLGEAAADRTAALASLDAPEFALPDLHGRVHRLSDYRGRKVLLAAYASW